MSDQRNLRAYYIVPDEYGKFTLWEGYIPNESNLHYARFYGINNMDEEIWNLERTEMPQNAIICCYKENEQC